ncbi:hypothetical protein [Rhizobium sp. CF142]|uniref:hypothetical protein n=1 Tax=Rhizobium sp. CF142 TaxID=1144314 RepID=UPI00026EF7FE|nr:hypothetical protein [Rhizobium sp. CF142]EJJ28838.1 hypothetical protein PMI11_02921 [Rhizobium sp. CF142]
MKPLIAANLLLIALHAGPVRGEQLSAFAQVIEDRRSHGVDEPLAGEDSSCSVVNRAIQRGYNSSRYSVRDFEALPNGEANLAFEARYAGRYAYILTPGLGWSILRREGRNTVTDVGPVFRNCHNQTNANYNGMPAIRIDAQWRRGYRTAETRVIISLVDGMPLRIDSHFTSNTPFATEHAFEIWETDRAKIQKPDAKPDLPW